MKNLFTLRPAALLLGLTCCVFSCAKLDLDFKKDNDNKKSPDLEFYALAGGTTLDRLNARNPNQALSSATISGLQQGETILAIDFRPATGQLYGLGSTSRIYVINPETGAARGIGAGAFTPALNGTVAGFDFNPTVDRIRLVTTSGQNLRLNPETGTVAMADGMINGAAGAQVSAVAYTGNTAGSTSTVLYDIDISSGMLFKQDPPNNGSLVPVGDLKLKVEGNGGFDIAPDGYPLALFTVNGKATLFTIDLNSGSADVLAKLDKATMYTGIAIPTLQVSYAVTDANSLLIINESNAAAVITKPITGLQADEKLLGIDFRPANGQLYALGSTSRLYTLNTASGAAAMVGSTPLVPALQGTQFGFDFNPTVDRIRVVSDAGQNLRLHPDLGTVVFTDGMLNPGTPMVSAAAYTNNFAGATTTELLVLDHQTDQLLLQSPPNAGTLVARGSLGVDIAAANGFDIGGTSNKAWAVLTVNGSTKLYGVNTATGAVSAITSLPGAVTGFAVGLGF